MVRVGDAVLVGRFAESVGSDVGEEAKRARQVKVKKIASIRGHVDNATSALALQHCAKNRTGFLGHSPKWKRSRC